MKLHFKYTDTRGNVQTDITLYDTPEHAEYFSTLTRMQERFYVRMGHQEKAWRNKELLHTARCFEDGATASGVLLIDSPKIEDVRYYRTSLRNYAYASSEERPICPQWLTEWLRD